MMELSRGVHYPSQWRADLQNISNGSNSTCNPLLANDNLTDGKIPELMGIAVTVWLGEMLIFLIIRYCASDYSKVGLSTSHQWLTALYNRKKDTVFGSADERTKSWSTLMYEDKHWYSWMVNFFWKLKLSDIKSRCGPDASVYLSLELYLIALLTVVSVLSLGIILPINYTAGTLTKEGFPRTTISNVPSDGGILWVHTMFTLLYLCVTVAFMVHFSLRLGKLQQDYSNHTVMIQWIPTFIHREDLMQHLQESVPDCLINDIQMAYDVTRIIELSKQLENISDELKVVQSVKNELGIRETLQIGWRKIFCCTDRFQEDARSYLESEYSNIKRAIEVEKNRIRNHKRLGIAFVTFQKKMDAKNFCSSHKLCRSRPHSSLYQSVNARWWWVSLAPFPLDILWKNLSLPYIVWWIRWLLINIILFVFLFFFTTPPILLVSITEIRAWFSDTLNTTDIPELDTTFGGNELAKISFSTLLLLLFASLLPFVVSRTSYLEVHWTESFRQQTIMRKTYIFLLLMVIILPSVGLASLSALGELALEGETAIENRLQCVFLPNNGAFFVGYVIISTFIGTGFELLRVPELLFYIFRMLKAKTQQQREIALKKAAEFDFRYGLRYAWNLVIFNLVMSFSLTTPIITPFGVLYFVIKYYTDRYNIYYVYRPAPFQGRQFIHRSAINFVIVGGVHLQLSTLFFSIIRLGRLDPRSVLMMVTFALTLVLCIGIMFFGWFKHLLPQLRLRMGKEYRMFGQTTSGMSGNHDNNEESEDVEGEVIAKGSYIPPVLREGQLITSQGDLTGYQSFGSTDRMGRVSPGADSAPSGERIAVTKGANKNMSTLERSSKSKGAKYTLQETVFGEGGEKYLV